MDSEFFTDETDNQNENHNIQTNQEAQAQPNNNVQGDEYQQQHQQHDEFDFGDTQYEAPQINIQNAYQASSQQGGDQFGNYQNFESNTAVNAQSNKIRQEEDRIQSELRDKANKQYELKNKRREQGSKQLQQFQDKKQEEAMARRQSNRNKQNLNSQQSSLKEGVTGWRKVAENVQLKQSENQGKKNISRMRQAIINKKSDEK